MHPAWQRELSRFAGWAVLCLAAGFLLDALVVSLLAGALLYLGWHLYHLTRLHQLLRDSREMEIPEARGVWGDIYRDLYRLRQRHQRSKTKLENIVSQFQASTAALPDAAVVLDPNGRILWFNEATVGLLGFRSPQDLGQRVVNLIRNPSFTALMQGGRQEQIAEIVSPVNSGQRIALRIIPYGNEQRLLIARDVSHQQRLEQMRRDFVANASHELRTPLTVLRGYLEMMVEEAGKKGALQEWLSPIGDMARQVTRMSNIIDDLLKLARLEANEGGGRHERVAVGQLLSKLVEEGRGISGGGHTIELDAESGLELYGHASELHSIFSNLLMNAIQYTAPDGDVRLKWWSDAAGAHFSVRDTGIGIEARHIPRLTERFYRADPGRSNRTGGTGLGLAIVKHALEHHEGRLEIASELNVGSIFTCHFPSDRIRRRQAA
jgi:two-component system phosphate regulon sensor histidine kinase PhoR